VPANRPWQSYGGENLRMGMCNFFAGCSKSTIFFFLRKKSPQNNAKWKPKQKWENINSVFFSPERKGEVPLRPREKNVQRRYANNSNYQNNLLNPPTCFMEKKQTWPGGIFFVHRRNCLSIFSFFFTRAVGFGEVNISQKSYRKIIIRLWSKLKISWWRRYKNKQNSRMSIFVCLCFGSCIRPFPLK